MLNSPKIKASLSLFVPQKNGYDPLIFHLDPGETIFGSDIALSTFVLDFDEIDKVQAKISIFEYGECSFESLSQTYDNFKSFEMIPGFKHLLKLRRNKEYDLMDGSVIYISKYRAVFNVEFEPAQENSYANNFTSTLFIPDREFIEDEKVPNDKNGSNNHQRIDSGPTQIIDDHENERKRSAQIRRIFRHAVERIKKTVRERNGIGLTLHESNLNDDALTKFVNLYDSMKEEIIGNSKCSHISHYSSSNSKGLSTVESPKIMGQNSLNFRNINFANGGNDVSDYPPVENIKQKTSIVRDDLPLEETPLVSHRDPVVALEQSQRDPQKKNIEQKLFASPNIKILESESLKSKSSIQNSPIQQESHLKNPSPQIKEIPQVSDEKPLLLEPTVRQSQISQNMMLSPTIHQSQKAPSSPQEILAATMRQSQTDVVLGSTLRQSQAEVALGATMRESQMLMAPTIRESQIPESKSHKKEDESMIFQKNEEKMKRLIRDSKKNPKKRKIELPDLIKIEKKKNMEKKMQEEQFQSLKLFIKDKIDDLDDLFEKDSATNKKKESLGPELQTQADLRNICFEENLKEIDENQVKLNESNTCLVQKDQQKTQKNGKKQAKVMAKTVGEEEKPKTESNNQNESKKPKLYLSQKTLCFTSNESIIHSSKKPCQRKKQFTEKSESENENEEKKGQESDEGESFYHIPQITEPKNPGLDGPISNLSNSIANIHFEKNNKNDDSGTEKMDSGQENDVKTEKYHFDDEELKSEKNETDKKISTRNLRNSQRLPEKMKIKKTLTQIYSSQSEGVDVVLCVSLCGIKLKKSEIEALRVLKIEIVDDIIRRKCDVMIMNQLKKDHFLYMAINKGIDIISRRWIDDTLAAKSIQLIDNYHFKDADFERENNIFIDQMILKSKLQGGTFTGYGVWISSSQKHMKEIIESGGGLILSKMPAKNEEKTLIILDENKRRLIMELAEKNVTFYFTEFILEACLKQEFVL